jgi:hypothetical protein
MPRSLAHQFPQRGQYYTSDDGAQSGLDEGILYIVKDTVLSALTNNQDPEDRLDDVTLPAGTVINGNTTGFTVTSGLVYHGYD